MNFSRSIRNYCQGTESGCGLHNVSDMNGIIAIKKKSRYREESWFCALCQARASRMGSSLDRRGAGLEP